MHLVQMTLSPCPSISPLGALGVTLLRDLVESSTESNEKARAGASGLTLSEIQSPEMIQGDELTNLPSVTLH